MMNKTPAVCEAWPSCELGHPAGHSAFLVLLSSVFGVLSACASTAQQPVATVTVSVASAHVSQFDPLFVRMQIVNLTSVPQKLDILPPWVEKEASPGVYSEWPLWWRPPAVPRPLDTLPANGSMVREFVPPFEATQTPGTYRVACRVLVGASPTSLVSVHSAGQVTYSVAVCAANGLALSGFPLTPDGEPEPDLADMLLVAAFGPSMPHQEFTDAEIVAALSISGLSAPFRQVLKAIQANNALGAQQYAVAISIVQAELALGALDSDCGSLLGRLRNLEAAAQWRQATTQAQFDRVTASYNQFLATHQWMQGSYHYSGAPTRRRATLPP